jgi:hypothetical protein
MTTSSATRALEQILGAIDAQLDRLNGSPGRIADARAAVLKRLKDALSGGFPPIDWLQQRADLAQLTSLFEIDACIWSGGRSLKQFSKVEHAVMWQPHVARFRRTPLKFSVRRELQIAMSKATLDRKFCRANFPFRKVPARLPRPLTPNRGIGVNFT